MILCRFRYRPEDVDCKNCTEYRKKRDAPQVCCWLEERAEAGVVTYAVLAFEFYERWMDGPFGERIRKVLSGKRTVTYGAEIAKALLDYGEHFTFNFFELRGAARLLAQGWSLEQVEAYTMENGCDAAPEEALESRSALQAFQNGDPNYLEVPKKEMRLEMR